MQNFIKLNAVYYDKDMAPKSYEITVNVDTIAKVEPMNGKNWQYQACVTFNDKTWVWLGQELMRSKI